MESWCFTLLLLNFVLGTCFLQNISVRTIEEECTVKNNLIGERLSTLLRSIVFEMESKRKGDAGKIAIIGGSQEYTGAPYFSAISALKIGADLVYVITTKDAAPVIKSYSPDLIVYPYLTPNTASKIHSLLNKMDVVIIGPGLGRELSTINLIYDIINKCKDLRKPLVIDADGLYAVSKNISVIQNYPSPGIILTPNYREADKLKSSIPYNNSNWFKYWGEYVTVLAKGGEDQYHSSIPLFDWVSSYGGTGRRVGGQGDILSGALGTLLNWALRSRVCGSDNINLAQSIATFSAARFTRICNSMAYEEYGRSLTASDMLKYIHPTFKSLFRN